MDGIKIGIDMAKGKDMTALKLCLPFCPSLNMAYPTTKTGRRVKSKRFKDWLKECPDLSGSPSFKKCTVSYLFFFPDDRVRDGQSYMKLPLDYLVDQGILEDDNRRIVKGEQWFDGGIDRKNPRIEITIKEILL